MCQLVIKMIDKTINKLFVFSITDEERRPRRTMNQIQTTAGKMVVTSRLFQEYSSKLTVFILGDCRFYIENYEHNNMCTRSHKRTIVKVGLFNGWFVFW